MSETLPLFPLGTVLYPGLLLPLRVFEERYRQLVRDLLAGPEPRTFGVIAIREGRETGPNGILTLHEIGCTATVRQVTELDDGRYDLVTVGAQRFLLTGTDDTKPYLQGEVELLAEETGDDSGAVMAARSVQDAFRTYLRALAERGVTQVSVPELPDDPILLSYLVAASIVIDLRDKQALLAEPDALHRLVTERMLLSRETTMLRTLTATPAPDLRNSPYSSN
jgi:Lon protease-like protein